MRSSPSKVVRFFPIKIKQNWQQAVPKPDATREKGKWLQTKLPTQKSPYPKQPPITKRTGYLSHTGDYLTADPKRKRSLRTSPTPIDCKPYSVTRLATLFEPICLEPKGLRIWGKFTLPLLLSINRRIRETSCMRDSCQKSNRWSCFHSSGYTSKKRSSSVWKSWCRWRASGSRQIVSILYARAFASTLASRKSRCSPAR